MIDKYKPYEKVLLYSGVFLFLFFILAPFVEALLVSVKPLDHLFSAPWRLLPEKFSLTAYVDIWENVPLLGRYILNSLFISATITLLALVCIIPAAFAFARFEFRGRATILGAFLAVNMFSGAVLLIPLYRLMRQVGLLNSYAAMIVPGLAFVIPTGVWLLRAYMLRIPRELEEAARADGASRFYIMRRVILPLSLPGVLVVSAATFLTAYAQQFVYALTFNNKQALMPLPVGLMQFFGRQEVIWNELMAASLIGILPVLLMFIFLQRYLVAGLTAGAVKA